MSDYALKKEQERLERDSVQMGIERYMATVEREHARGRAWDMTVTERRLEQVLQRLNAVLLDTQARALEHNLTVLKRGGHSLSYAERMNMVSPEVLAYVTLKTVLVRADNDQGSRVQGVAKAIGAMVEAEYWWAEARKREAKAARERAFMPPNRIEMMRRRVKHVSPRSVKKWMKFLDDLSITSWSEIEKLHVGAACLDAVAPELVGMVSVFDKRVARGRGHTTEKVVRVETEFVDELAELHQEAALLRPWLLPMVASPIDWTLDGGVLRGGYRVLTENLLKVGRHAHHTSIDSVPETVLQALNVLQSTAWCINRPVLAVIEKCFSSDQGPLPYAAPQSFPEMIPAETWETMTRQERGYVRAARALVYDHNNTQEAKKLALTRAITVAAQFKDYTRIYFPHSIDWRGRAYPIPQDLHPQGSDMVKAMLKFGDGKALGDLGLGWLECTVATTYGLDKQDRATQQLWTHSNWDNIMGVASDPCGHLDFWAQADEPWQFLAASIELHEAAKLTDPTEYVSHLPISLDGSCNGLQHLSAMGKDPVGAAAVNLTPGPRQDIYQIVADKVASSVENSSDPMARQWLGKITRRQVKRGVMTTPYGVTPRGIATQLKKDGFTKGMADELAAANALRDHMVAAISDTVVVGKQIMKWMQECAEALAKENQGISWSTPMGLKVTQMYTHPDHKRLQTLVGRLYIDLPSRSPKVVINKQKNSVAPNIIHSFDASHMMMVVLEMPEGTSFAMVHDSYGCHACDVDELLRVTKETFVDIYRHSWFEILRTDFMFYSSGCQLPEPPQRGDLNIDKVLESDYFFA